MAFRCTKPLKDPVATLAYRPWTVAIEPFQVSPRTWYVAGQTWVGCWLIETSEGCILIDTAIPESLYMLVDSIYKIGHKPSDIKKILLSHGHFDHTGAAEQLRRLTGAELYISKEDWEFYQKVPEETLVLDKDSHPIDFVADKFYSEEESVVLGDISVRTMLTPGHTIGCTSFFWEETNPADGKTYTLGMHGGVGANTMNDKYYSESRYLTPELRERFLADEEKLAKIHVDIALPSHPNQIDITDRAGQYTNENMCFADDTVWADFLHERVRQVKELMK